MSASRTVHSQRLQSAYQQVDWGSRYQQEQIGWPANDYGVVYAPPQQEQRH